MVHLQEHGGAVVLESLEHVQLPERPPDASRESKLERGHGAARPDNSCELPQRCRRILDVVQLPERLATIERTRQDTSHRAFQLQPATRLRDRRSPKMEVQVEPVVVDPERPGEAPRQTEHPLPQAWGEVYACLGDASDVLVREPFVLARREDGHPRDVHVHRGSLQVEEARVEAGEAFGRHGNPTVSKC